jgi:hypothetical protein
MGGGALGAGCCPCSIQKNFRLVKGCGWQSFWHLQLKLSSASPLRGEFTLLPLAQASGRYERPSGRKRISIFDSSVPQRAPNRINGEGKRWVPRTSRGGGETRHRAQGETRVDPDAPASSSHRRPAGVTLRCAKNEPYRQEICNSVFIYHLDIPFGITSWVVSSSVLAENGQQPLLPPSLSAHEHESHITSFTRAGPESESWSAKLAEGSTLGQ